MHRGASPRGRARNRSHRHGGVVRAACERGADRRGVVSVSDRASDRDQGGFDRPGPDQWDVNCRPERLREELEGSLRRLRLERIDVWQLHRIDPEVPEEKQFETIRKFQQEGKIRHVGLSEVKIDEIKRARKFFPVVSVQNRYNLADREWEKVLDYCEGEGIAFIPWYPLQVGKLAKGGGRLASIAKKHHATPSQVALAWLLKRSPVILPIPGTAKVKHLEENAGAAAIQLTDEELAEITSRA